MTSGIGVTTRTTTGLPQPPPPSPFVGLVPYSVADADWFFGRSREIHIISANLITSPLTLLYGPSGVGKSSVIRAGVTSSLRRRSEQEREDDSPPEFAVVVFSEWRNDPVTGILTATGAELDRLGIPTSQVAGSESLLSGLRSAADRLEGRLLIVLDQFEEFFLYHAREEGPGTFGSDFPRVVESIDLRVNFLAAIREDALARLDLFKGRMTNPFANRLSIKHLSVEQAREAIEGPVAKFNRLVVEPGARISLQPEFTDAVLDELTTGRVLLGQSGLGEVGRSREGQERTIETPFLQLVLKRVWDEEKGLGSSEMRRATLQRLGGAEQIVYDHLASAMGKLPTVDLDIAASIFHFLVTPSGSKIAHTADDLADYTARERADIERVLERLTGQEERILRPIAPPVDTPGPTSYEISHDVLAPAVLDWRSRFVQAQEQEEAHQRLEAEKRLAQEILRTERRRARLYRTLALAMVLLLALATGLGWWALSQRDEANKAQAKAQATRLASQSILAIPSDPAEGVALAVRSLRTRLTQQGERALRNSMPTSRLLAVMDPGDLPQEFVEFALDGDVLVTAGVDGVPRVWDPKTGNLLRALSGHAKQINSMEVDPSGHYMLTSSDDGTARVSSVSGNHGVELDHNEPVVAAGFHPQEAWVATATLTDGVWIWDWREPTPTVVARLGLLGDSIATGSNYVTSLAFSPDGSFLIAGTALGYVIGYELDGLRPTLAFETDVEAPYVNTLEVDPDGERVAAGNSDGTISILDAQTGETQGESLCCFGSHDVNAVTFSNDGSLVLGAGAKIAKSFNIHGGYYEVIMLGHTDWVYDTSFSHDQRSVVTASSDGTAAVWSADTGRNLLTLSGHTDGVVAARFSPDDETVATVGRDGTIRLWDIQTGIGLFSHTDMVTDVDWAPDGSRVVTADWDGNAFVWDPATGRRLFALSEYRDHVTEVDINPAGTQVLVAGSYTADGGGDRGVVDFFDLSNGDYIDSLFPNIAVWNAFYTSEGQRVVTLTDRVTVWNAEARQGNHEKLDRIGELGRLQEVIMSADEQRAVTFGFDGTVTLWDIDGLIEITTLQGVHRTAAFSSDGRYLVTDGPRNSAQLWAAETGKLLRKLPGGSSPISATAFSADTAWVVAGDADGNSYVWTIDGNLLATLRMQADYINSIEMSPTGRSILAASDDWSAKIYRCETCVALKSLKKSSETYLKELAERGAPQYQREAHRPAPG